MHIRACGSRYTCKTKPARILQNNFIRTPCHSWVFQAFLPSVRHLHQPGHLLCVDVSSEDTPIHFKSRKNSFNLASGLTNTVAASEDFDHLPQQSAASGSHYSAVSTLPTLLNFFIIQRWELCARQRFRCKC